jgi:hypothetical protein
MHVTLRTELTEVQRAAFAELFEALPGEGMIVRAAFRVTSTGRLVVSGLLIGGDVLTADMLRRVPIAQLEEMVNSEDYNPLEAIEALPPLRRGDDPVEFSKLVAEHYKAWARAVPNPVAKMADRAGVKLPTVHGWIREARLRGLLPPAKRGKAQ